MSNVEKERIALFQDREEICGCEKIIPIEVQRAAYSVEHPKPVSVLGDSIIIM
jgi:hypothetical protein